MDGIFINGIPLLQFLKEEEVKAQGSKWLRDSKEYVEDCHKFSNAIYKPKPKTNGHKCSKRVLRTKYYTDAEIFDMEESMAKNLSKRVLTYMLDSHMMIWMNSKGIASALNEQDWRKVAAVVSTVGRFLTEQNMVEKAAGERGFIYRTVGSGWDEEIRNKTYEEYKAWLIKEKKVRKEAKSRNGRIEDPYERVFSVESGKAEPGTVSPTPEPNFKEVEVKLGQDILDKIAKQVSRFLETQGKDLNINVNVKITITLGA